ncbi:MAG: hypothetical protein K9W43_09015 [Candidatus Thorarchaeota archaeon]|nr:hypothetical protein [Candidatus Thorarchaeota archaeon]
MDEPVLTFTTKQGEASIRLETEVTQIDLSYRRITAIDLRPLIHCSKLQAIDLSNNHLKEIDLWPLMRCTQLVRLSLKDNPLERIDVTPLFACPHLATIEVDPVVEIHANYEIGKSVRRPRPLDGLRRRRMVKWMYDDESLDPLKAIERIKNEIYTELADTYKGPDTEPLVDETLKFNIVDEVKKKIQKKIATAEKDGDFKTLFLLERGLEYLQSGGPSI